jgi:hypothetical protein
MIRVETDETKREAFERGRPFVSRETATAIDIREVD